MKMLNELVKRYAKDGTSLISTNFQNILAFQLFRREHLVANMFFFPYQVTFDICPRVGLHTNMILSGKSGINLWRKPILGNS